MTMKAALVMLATLTGAIASPGCASGAAALVGVALCCPSAPAPSSAEAHSLRGWRDR